MMTQTQNYTNRMRLNRQIDFGEDFRKKFMTRDYGNYDKYEKNSIEEEVDRGETDVGIDNFYKNFREMKNRLNTIDTIQNKQKKE